MGVETNSTYDGLPGKVAGASPPRTLREEPGIQPFSQIHKHPEISYIPHAYS